MGFISESREDGIMLREFDLERSGRIVPGVLWQPQATGDNAALICCGHGASGDRHQAPIPWLARQLATRHGAAVLAIDGPVHGRRQVGPGGREAFWPEFNREGAVEDMVGDWQAALDFVLAQAEFAGDTPVGYWGLSMGTIFGAPLVAAEPRIRAAVLGLMGIAGPHHYVPRISAAAAAIEIPVLFIMQLEDELFTREQALALFDALASRDKRLHANPGLHPEVPMEELHASVAFLIARLAGTDKWGHASFPPNPPGTISDRKIDPVRRT